jgi:hypothetical protein
MPNLLSPWYPQQRTPVTVHTRSVGEKTHLFPRGGISGERRGKDHRRGAVGIRPPRIRGRYRMRPITAREVEELVGRGAQVVDVLPREEYEEEHLPGAVNIPLKDLDAERVASLDRDRPVIVYCHDYQ